MQCAYASTDDYRGLNDKQTCLRHCIESYGAVQGIYLPGNKCGCCPSWDRSSRIGGYRVSHLYTVSEDIASQMSALQNPSVFRFPSNLPSCYGSSSMFNFLGNGYCIDWHRSINRATSSGYHDTSGSSVQNSQPDDPGMFVILRTHVYGELDAPGDHRHRLDS